MKKNLVILCILAILLGCNNGSGSNGTEWPEELGSTTLIMYYGAADNDGEYDLYGDINEMEMVPSDKTKIVALFDRCDGIFDGDGNWTDTRAYELGYDPGGFNMTLGANTKRIAIPSLGISVDGTTELATDDGTVLEKFVQFCYENYSADSYVLILPNRINRSDSFGNIDLLKAVCRDRTSGPNEKLYLKEVGLALSATGQKLDLLAFDVSFMGTVEVIYELKEVSHFIVASEEAIPGFGFPYYQILRDFRNFPDKSPKQVGQTMVKQFITTYIQNDCVEGYMFGPMDLSITLSDTNKVIHLASALSQLGSHLSQNYENIAHRLNSLKVEDATGTMVDLGNYIETELQAMNGPNQTGDFGVSVQKALDEVILLHGKSSSGLLKNSTGLAIYFPITSANYNQGYSSHNFLFAAEAPGWKNFVSSSNPSYTDNDPEDFYTVILSRENPTYTGTIHHGDCDRILIIPSDTIHLQLTVPDKINLDMNLEGLNTFGESLGYIVAEEGGPGEDEDCPLDMKYATTYNVLIYYIDSDNGALPDNYTLTVKDLK